MLNTLLPTANGLDMIQAWFLRLGSPIFAAPLAQLFQQSLAAGVAPRQWKSAVITPAPKVATPTQPSDFRPITITPVLSRSLERFVVRKYIYPALLQPNLTLYFRDQFAFIRLDYCCNRCDYAHRALNVEQQRLRPCLRLRFFEGV